MQVIFKLFATLRENRDKESTLEVESGSLVRDIVDRLGIPEKEAKIIFINGRGSSLDQPLEEGDTVSIFPPVGGG